MVSEIKPLYHIFYSPNLFLKLLNIFQPGTPSFSDSILITTLSLGDVDEEEKEREHSSMQDQLDKELQELDKRLQQKEVLFFHLSIVFGNPLFSSALHVQMLLCTLNLLAHYIIF